MDNLFTDILELAILAGYSAKPDKLKHLELLSGKLDCLKLFLKILWEIKALDNQKYSALSLIINEIGKMAGGWLKAIRPSFHQTD
ncbi:MAG: hypothetical protein A2821_04150 [Candidatus Magasanikbacteria bacterium RIFCSPHIGHO2_01_FULL_41_23]|uniref:Four helix bundle protein n=1 Tax=Candidatus Magasanikbacteria bacterium RIFCSPLOWO2_01_FULL_40_15 TaxID=1798686 RepID=A0A1F6N2G8_9BACT|nr:MAG: hypothetical protein A2821_04150 [Candidatus Magasanikbacteria bacterium RIFCSPHIGHO2_01_FULL_41_23]OGH67232.1 MAG: hypothetical protein A3C66_00620 [Candidatus Magasanikbacteria bacterium RIFCSPHIGHO2_02_FULL_41_35]OGH74813.1 MAG: hypothetical protein A3F22_01565 [Candidatus Magasanikbacteria bacterium RIFCSPHIGHO2_12_FULL_41_16]OGH78081.1 MAG: hypothetical protein A2983_02055 [Candidatus Magasanikbacteria bacterium RIFCSPLOWO2_01_FULL_40_15]